VDIRLIITGSIGIAALAWLLVDADKAKILLGSIGGLYSSIVSAILPKGS
jgi:hypothetical protein